MPNLKSKLKKTPKRITLTEIGVLEKRPNSYDNSPQIKTGTTTKDGIVPSYALDKIAQKAVKEEMKVGKNLRITYTIEDIN